jgi:hypothetical protein
MLLLFIHPRTFIIDIEANEDVSYEEKLSSFLKTGPDWGRLKTSVPGIFVLKMPAYKSSPARLSIELNPTDESGSPTKKRGLVLRSSEELEEYKTIFQYDKLIPLLKSVDDINPPRPKTAHARLGEDVLNI